MIGRLLPSKMRRTIDRPPVRRLPLWRATLAVGSIIAGAFFLFWIPLVAIPLLLFGIVFGLSNIARAPSRQMILLTQTKPTLRIGIPGGLDLEDKARARQREIDTALIDARRARERG